MENNFENKMENLKTPDTGSLKHQEILKVGFMNARKSARIGIVFIIIPALLIIIGYLKIKFLIHLNFFTSLGRFISKGNQTNWLIWIIHILLCGLPLLAIIINLLAITHFYINKSSKELIITIQYRLKNLIVSFISLGIILFLFFYVLLGNYNVK